MRRYGLFAVIAAILATLFMISPAHAQLTADHAQRAGFSKLSESDKAEIIKQIAAKTEAAQVQSNVDNVTTASNVVNKVVANTSDATADRIVNLTERLGAAFVNVAKGLGVAVNEFATSPVGILTAALVVWHFMGGVLVHLIGGVIVLVVGLGYLFWMKKRQQSVRIEYHDKTNWLGRPIIKSIEKDGMTDDQAGSYLFCAAVVLVASLVTVFTY